MFPTLNVYLDGAADPIEVQPTSVDLWIFEDLTNKPLQSSSEQGLRLTLAYLGLTGLEPPTLADVRHWAREHKVTVTIGGDVTPTKPADIAG